MAYVFAAVVEYAIANFIDKPDIDRLARRAFPSTFAVVWLVLCLFSLFFIFSSFYYAYYAVCVNELPGLSEQMTRWVGDERMWKLKPWTANLTCYGVELSICLYIEYIGTRLPQQILAALRIFAKVFDAAFPNVYIEFQSEKLSWTGAYLIHSATRSLNFISSS